MPSYHQVDNHLYIVTCHVLHLHIVDTFQNPENHLGVSCGNLCPSDLFGCSYGNTSPVRHQRHNKTQKDINQMKQQIELFPHPKFNHQVVGANPMQETKM